MITNNRKKAGARSSRSARGKNVVPGRYSLARNLNGLGSSAQSAIRSGRQAMDSAYRMASGVSQSLPNARDMTPRNLQRMVESHPLLISVIGIGVGLLLGILRPIVMSESSASRVVSAQSARSRTRRTVRARRARNPVRRAKSSRKRSTTQTGRSSSSSGKSSNPSGKPSSQTVPST